MAGTFEIVFSGLCLFVFNPMNADKPKEVAVNLVRTDQVAKTSCPDASDGQKIKLHRHKPYLVIPEGAWVDCSVPETIGKCSPRDMPGDCVLMNGKWHCGLENLELCVETGARPPLEVNRTPADGTPGRSHPAAAFGWIAHVKGIGGDQDAKLRSEVTQKPVGKDNSLVVSRIRSSHGTLTTKALGKRGNQGYVVMDVKPDTSYPRKTFAEHMSLELTDLDGKSVRLKKCVESETKYWWEFKPGNKPIRIGVENLTVTPCDDETGDGCTVKNAKKHQNRLRHFLWYYELVEWDTDNKCPTYHLPAPTCPKGKCRKTPVADLADVLSSRPGPNDVEDADNTLCPPSTYP